MKMIALKETRSLFEAKLLRHLKFCSKHKLHLLSPVFPRCSDSL